MERKCEHGGKATRPSCQGSGDRQRACVISMCPNPQHVKHCATQRPSRAFPKWLDNWLFTVWKVLGT